MAEITSETIDNFLVEINKGISNSYFKTASGGKLPSKYIVNEAKADLEHILSLPIPSTGVDSRSSRRLQIYLDIVRLLDNIPEQEFVSNRDLSLDLHLYTIVYSTRFPEIELGNVAVLFDQKYRLIDARTDLVNRQTAGMENGSTQKLIELIDKYIELLKVDYSSQPASS